MKANPLSEPVGRHQTMVTDLLSLPQPITASSSPGSPAPVRLPRGRRIPRGMASSILSRVSGFSGLKCPTEQNAQKAVNERSDKSTTGAGICRAIIGYTADIQPDTLYLPDSESVIQFCHTKES